MDDVTRADRPFASGRRQYQAPVSVDTGGPPGDRAAAGQFHPYVLAECSAGEPVRLRQFRATRRQHPSPVPGRWPGQQRSENIVPCGSRIGERCRVLRRRRDVHANAGYRGWAGWRIGPLNEDSGQLASISLDVIGPLEDGVDRCGVSYRFDSGNSDKKR
jgi:hypothetical protein